MKRVLTVVVMMVISSSLTSTASLAWRETGHFTVCEIAERNLVPEARQRIAEILDGADFSTQCTWPDMVRHSDQWKHTFPWHFINLDDGKEYFAPGNVNPAGDVLQILLLAEAKLSDPETPPEEMRRYLRFLGHLAGDSHQPLHSGRKVDLGGNKVIVTWFGERTFESIAIELAPEDDGTCSQGESYIDASTGECVMRAVTHPQVNLHKVWDLLMLQRFITKRKLRPEAGDSEFLHKAYATKVARWVDPSEDAAAIKAPFGDWVEESMQARVDAYDVGRGKLRRRYFRRNIDLLNGRIALAGHRLAFTLNRLFGPVDSSPEVAAIRQSHLELRRQLVELAGGDSPLAALP